MMEMLKVIMAAVFVIVFQVVLVTLAIIAIGFAFKHIFW